MPSFVGQDRLPQTVRQVQAAFEAVLDIIDLQHTAMPGHGLSGMPSCDRRHFLEGTAADLLSLGAPQIVQNPS